MAHNHGVSCKGQQHVTQELPKCGLDQQHQHHLKLAGDADSQAPCQTCRIVTFQGRGPGNLFEQAFLENLDTH